MKYGAGKAMTTGVAIGVAMTVCLVAIVGIVLAATFGKKAQAHHVSGAPRVATCSHPPSHPTKCFDCERQLGAHYRNVSPQVSHGYPEVSMA